MHISCFLLFALFLSTALSYAQVRLGNEVLARSNFKALKGKRVGLLTNPSGVNRQLEPTLEVLRRNNIDSNGKRARQISPSDLREFDYIVAMDAENVADLEFLAGWRRFGDRKSSALNNRRIPRLLEFAPASETLDVPDPYYTGNFDQVYRLVQAGCQGLLAQCRVRFLRTSVSGIQEGAVVTAEGRFTAPVIVDCSGWRRAITGGAPTEPRSRHHSFGLETRTSLRDEGLTFLLDRRLIPQGLGWIFPVGSGSLIGLGSYVGRSKLKPALERLLREHGTSAGSYHGTYFPNRLLRPTVDRVFAVGDAAGQQLGQQTDASAREIVPRIEIREDVSPDKVVLQTQGLAGLVIGVEVEVNYHVTMPASARARPASRHAETARSAKHAHA